MKIGHGNAHFIADAHSALPLDTIRQRWRDGDYGKVRTEYAIGWLTMAGRNVKGRNDA